MPLDGIVRIYLADRTQGDGYIKNTLSLLARSDSSIRLQFGLSKRVLNFWCNPSKTGVNAYENPLYASQETNCVLSNVTRLLMLFNKQKCL